MSAEDNRQQLEQLLADARERGDADRITELEADLFHQFSDEPQLGDSEPIT